MSFCPIFKSLRCSYSSSRNIWSFRDFSFHSRESSFMLSSTITDIFIMRFLCPIPILRDIRIIRSISPPKAIKLRLSDTVNLWNILNSLSLLLQSQIFIFTTHTIIAKKNDKYNDENHNDSCYNFVNSLSILRILVIITMIIIIGVNWLLIISLLWWFWVRFGIWLRIRLWIRLWIRFWVRLIRWLWIIVTLILTDYSLSKIPIYINLILIIINFNVKVTNKCIAKYPLVRRALSYHKQA